MRKRIGWTNLENEIGKKQEGRNAWKREKCMKKNKQKGHGKTRWTQNLKENKINGYKESGQN